MHQHVEHEAADRSRKRPDPRQFPVHLRLYIRVRNTLVRLVRPLRPAHRELEGLRGLEHPRMAGLAITDHLPRLFAEAVSARPRLLVELGVEEGHSTRVLAEAAKVTGANLLSVDIDDCPDVLDWEQWRFVQADDVGFASRFRDWCSGEGLEPSVDVLFVDTSHEYRHTVDEIAAWFAHLSPHATVMFHDTNVRRVYVRKGGSAGLGHPNDRGVIRAIEDYLGVQLDETRDFVDYIQGWLVVHYAMCSGFTVMKRIETG